ncbi:nitrate- and nitrite sensing domain-containing protein [Streptomyces sp. RFCAC02]|uniref:sensor histidine kinase n=1 Tax=Streptomyces sp. RFCAC02 TaxID=2499143 RepID=UPI001F0E5BE8|nr:nitrate- and nitrite sensing domain-containing protein [Streptomyces sp. RFCAC02]
MRAQVRKTTLHDPAGPSPDVPSGTAGSSGHPAPQGARAHAASRRRRVRVRSRLLAGVLLTGFALTAAGAPALHGAWQDWSTAGRLVDDARLAGRALSLSHVLADERDALVVAGATRDPGVLADALPEDARERADRTVGQVAPDTEGVLRERLDALPDTRQRALDGEATPAETYTAYTDIIDGLDGLFRTVSRARPERAADPTADALPDLARAVHASSATRGLLLAGLTGEGDTTGLTALARREAVREEAALDDFAAAVDDATRAALDAALTGDAADADTYLGRLTEGTPIDADEAGLDPDGAQTALLARTGALRGLLGSLTEERVADLESLRGDDLTDLQVTVCIVVVALALALTVNVHTARSLTRPLAAVRLGSRRVAADPTGQEPVKYTGRNDEFAEVVSAVNALHSRAVTLHRRAAEAARDAAAAAEEGGGLRAERDRLLAEQSALHGRLAALHGAVHGMFAHHAQRLLVLVGEQLAVIEGLEEHEADPDQLAVLFSLDHLAARMRRHGENLLLLAGAEPTQQLTEPVPLIDVARAAVSEIERYEVVETAPPPPAVRVTGYAARDLSHLLAELLDNATAFSPAGARVRLTGRWTTGELLLSVEDEGVGLSQARLAELNVRLADSVTPPPGADGSGHGTGIGMGLYTVARLAARHGLRCWLRQRPGGGTIAEVAVPATLVEERPGEVYAETGTGPITPAAGVPTAGLITPPGAAGPATPAAGVPLVPHARAAEPDGAAHAAAPAPGVEHGRADDTAPRPHGVTTSGLPKRTPGATPTVSEPTAAGRARAVDAEELRRRLGGFQRGARDGHRDAARTVEPRPGQSGEEMPS